MTIQDLALNLGWRKRPAEKSLALARGNAARDRKDWVLAAHEYRLHLNAKPNDFAIWVQLGHALKESGRPDDAFEAYGEAYRIAPQDPDLLLNLGHLHNLVGNFQEAAEHYHRSAEVDSNASAVAALHHLGATSRRQAGLDHSQVNSASVKRVPDRHKDLNIVLTENPPQLKTEHIFDSNRIAIELDELDRPTTGNQHEIKLYNQKYIELYKPYDASLEFKERLAIGTFDETRLMPSFDDLIEVYPELKVPYLDQTAVSLTHLAPHQRHWAEHGYLLIDGMISPDTCDEYLELRQRLTLGSKSFQNFTPYLDYDVIQRMFCSVEMHTLINDLIGEELGLHFNLTPFVSTERGWHQDEYLNPPETFGRYLAAWIAVDDVPEDSGPFEFIRGSHKLPTVSREKVMPYLKPQFQAGDANTQDWSGHSSLFVNPAYFFKFTRDRQPVTKFLGKKGDVLLWHSRLIHRGSPPKNPMALRPGIIGHYSPIRSARWFGGDIRRRGNGGYFWNFDS